MAYPSSCRRRRECLNVAICEKLTRARGRSALRPPDRGSSRFRRPPALRPREQIERVAPAGHAAHPDHRDLHRVGDRVTCASAIARIAGPESPPLSPPSQGSPLRGSSATRASVLISDSASPRRPAAARHRRDVGGVGRELHDQRLGGQRAARASSASSSRGSAPMSSPVSTFGHETFSSSAATAGCAPSASTSSRELVRG